jgi:hypothetical protein
VQQHKFPACLARRACPVGRRYRSPRTARYSDSDCFPERVRLGEAVSGEGYLVEASATSLSGGRSFRVEAVSPLRSEAPPPGPIGSSSAMPRSRWQAPPWREPDLVMACPATLPAIQCQITEFKHPFKKDASREPGMTVNFRHPAVFLQHRSGSAPEDAADASGFSRARSRRRCSNR